MEDLGFVLIIFLEQNVLMILRNEISNRVNLLQVRVISTGIYAQLTVDSGRGRRRRGLRPADRRSWFWSVEIFKYMIQYRVIQKQQNV